MKISSTWYLDLTKDQQIALKVYYENMATDLLWKQFQHILESKIDSACKPAIADYDKASWSHLQAHKNGQVQALTEIINLLPTNKDNQ